MDVEEPSNFREVCIRHTSDRVQRRNVWALLSSEEASANRNKREGLMRLKRGAET